MRRTAAWILFAASASLFASRFVAPAASAPEPRAARAVEAEQTPPALADVNREVERLRDRLVDVPQSPVPSRDPFSFGRAPERPRSLTPPIELVQPTPPQPVLPRLVAILSPAADAAASAHTAVVAMGDDVEFKSAGDDIGAFVVDAVTADALVLVDRASQVRYEVSLR